MLAPPTEAISTTVPCGPSPTSVTLGGTPSGGVLGPGDPRLPLDMQFNEGHVVAIVGFSTLMLFSGVGNITVLWSILRSRTKSQINLMLSHLAVADLLVTFLMMPMEIGWAVTVTWEGGDILCRLMSFFRAFGLFLSGFLVMCISCDRYCAVLHPLTSHGAAQSRGRKMLAVAWTASFVCSLPQALVFSTLRHPQYPWFSQCVTYGMLTTPTQEVLYSATGVVLMYLLPLITILYCYSAIILEICRRAVDMGEHRMRRSNSGNLCRAKVRTLKMTVTIVAVFLLCWTPYNVMLVWYFIDRSGALNLDPKVQRLLLLFACTNSSFNPLVYGVFNIRGRHTVSHLGASTTLTAPLPLPSSRLPAPSKYRSQSSRVIALRAEGARRPTL